MVGLGAWRAEKDDEQLRKDGSYQPGGACRHQGEVATEATCDEEVMCDGLLARGGGQVDHQGEHASRRPKGVLRQRHCHLPIRGSAW